MMILACLIIFSSCSEKEAKNISTEIEFADGSGNGVLAENSVVDFYFYYPENFSIKRDDSMIVVAVNDEEILQSDVQQPDSQEFIPIMTKPNLSAQVFNLTDDKYETIEQCWENFVLPSYQSIYQDIEIVSEDDLTVAEFTAKKYTYTCSLSDMKFKVSQIIFFKKQQVYFLTYTATESKYQTYINVLNTAAETFKFK